MNSFLDPVELSLASKGLRFANFLIDYIIYYLLNLFLITPLISMFILSTNGLGGIVTNTETLWLFYFFYFILSVFIYSIYFTLQEFLLNGRTFGKLITGTNVVMVTGEKPSFWTYFVRSLCRMIPFEIFSFFGETGWHDSISKTRVVKTSDFMMNKIKFNSIDEIGKTTE
jgi:uncharacterized RDD family membrane protein YckC